MIPRSTTEDALIANTGSVSDRFVALLKEHHSSMRALAVRVLNDQQGADDALQVAYTKAYVHRDSFKGESAFGTWLYRIVYRSCIDEQRRLKPGESLDADLIDTARAFEDRLGDKFRLHQALQTLSGEQRAAVWLVDAEGYSYAETAAMLDVPEGTVASRVVRARAALHNVLDAPEKGSHQ